MQEYLGVALALVGTIGVAGQALATRLATRRGRTSDVLVFNILITAGVLVGLSALFVPDPVVTPVSAAVFSASGVVSLLLGRAVYFAGIKRVGASRAEAIKASTPLFATVFALVALTERVTAPQLLGICLIVVGVALVSWEGMNADRVAGRSIPWVGLALPLAAAVLFGVEPILVSIGFREGTSVLIGSAIMTVSGSVCLLAYLRWRRTLPRMNALPAGEVRWYVLSGLASVVSLLGFYGGLKLARVSIIVPIVQTSPLFVVAASAVFLRGLERVTGRLVFSAVVVIAGAILVTVAG